jgi:hypothetical protein
LQKNQRNEARRNVTARISAEISNYIGNNGGEIPTEDANTATGFTGGFKVRYIDNAPAGTFDAPGGGSYVYDLYDEGSLKWLRMKLDILKEQYVPEKPQQTAMALMLETSHF